MIDFNIEIPNSIKCLPDTMYVEKIEYGERQTTKGLILQAETMDRFGTFVHSRWAKVKFIANNIKGVEVGDWILMKHGHWSTSMAMTIQGKDTKLWYISPKSFKEGLLAVSKTMPEQLKEYGITNED